MKIFHRLAWAGALIAAMQSAPALAATEIQLFFPVPVQGKLSKEMENLTARFNTEHPAYKVTPVFTGSYDETNLKTRAAIKAGKPPAAVIMSANFVLEYVINKEIEPYDDLIKAEGKTNEQYMDAFWPALRVNAVIDNHVYGIPFHNSTPLFYYNPRLFKEAGLDPDKPPVTWKEWIEMSQKLTKRDASGNVTQWGTMIPGVYDSLGWIVSGLDMSNGGEYYNHTYGGEVYYDKPTMLGTLKFLEDMVFKYKAMPEGLTDANAMSSAFFAGKTATMVQTTGAMGFIRENMKEPFKVAFMPRNVRNAVPIGGASLIIPKGLPAEQRKAAWELVKWFTSPEISGYWSRFTGYFAPNRHAYELPEMQKYIADNPNAKVALDQLQYAGPWFSTYNTVGVRKAMEDEVMAVLAGKKKAEQAGKDAQATADKLMRPYVEQTVLTYN